VSTGHLKFDGVTGGGPRNWKGGHGFKIASRYTRLIHFTSPVAGVAVRHVEFAFPTSEVDDSLAADHIYGVHGVSDLTLEYCYLHDTSRVFILSRGWVDVLVQFNCFSRNRSTAKRHAEAWSDHRGRRYVIRDNLWEDIEGTGVVVMLHGSAYDWEIHGNVVCWTGSPTHTGVGNGVFTTRSAKAHAHNWRIYNNTVVNGAGHNTFHRIYNGKNNAVKNNLWFNSRVSPGGAAMIDSNWYVGCGPKVAGPNDVSHPAGPDPFVDSARGDFRLRAASPAGEDVTTAGKRFHVDPNGVVRGSDGAWDRGAFEFGNPARAPGTALTGFRADGVLPAVLTVLALAVSAVYSSFVLSQIELLRR
jgi:hypothetical protein